MEEKTKTMHMQLYMQLMGARGSHQIVVEDICDGMTLSEVFF